MRTPDRSAPDRGIYHRRSSRYCDWFLSGWFRLSLGGSVALAAVMGLLTGAPDTYVMGQITLGVCVYIALSLLADRPLLNPIQAIVCLFYWWIGFGPSLVSAFNYFQVDAALARQVQVSAMEALWIVAPGVILYAIVARATLRWLSGKSFYARFLQPSGDNFPTNVFIVYTGLMVVSGVLITLLEVLGIVGREETSMLGGTKTTIWWVGVISAVGALTPMINSSLMTYLTEPWKKIPFTVKILIAVTIWQTIITALYGGWKGPLALLFALYVFAYISRFQRPPWMLITIVTVFFVLVIAPYVTYGRYLAAMAKVDSSGGRVEVFYELLTNPDKFRLAMGRETNVAVLFRGIFPLAAELTRRNSFSEGEWGGDTITWGFEVLVPRAILPEKRDMNIGNFFARTVGADVGYANRFDLVTNLAVTIPFEFVGNYGWFGGVLSFALMGVFWALLSAWLLSPARLSDHPWTPYVIGLTLLMEAPLGHFLSNIRLLTIPLIILFFINRVIFRGRI